MAGVLPPFQPERPWHFRGPFTVPDLSRGASRSLYDEQRAKIAPQEVGDQEEELPTQLSELVGDVVDFVAEVTDPAEEVFLEAVADVDPRTLVSNREFFNTLSRPQATFRIVAPPVGD